MCACIFSGMLTVVSLIYIKTRMLSVRLSWSIVLRWCMLALHCSRSLTTTIMTSPSCRHVKAVFSDCQKPCFHTQVQRHQMLEQVQRLALHCTRVELALQRQLTGKSNDTRTLCTTCPYTLAAVNPPHGC